MDWPGVPRGQTFGDERSTMVLSGEITAPRAFPRNESPTPDGTFGPYWIHEQLGTGGMASVHRAERRAGGVRQRVALKRMLPNAAEDPDLVKLFLDEARLVSLLRHRNIAEVYDYGSVGDEYFLAMELVAGPTLKQLLRHCAATVGLIPYPIALNLLIQVCDALAYAHDHTDAAGKPLQLVHRDVSPSNIVISSNGVVKLIDFGIAKTASTHTQVGIIKGKVGYIAPEYLQDSGLDRRADLWALGVIAYELLCNVRLFDGGDDFETMRLVRSQTITPPSHHNRDVPPELEAIVMTALERDPRRRWQNATALRKALAGVAKPSTNAEVMEWVEWVFAISDGELRPVRGSRQLTALTADFDAEPLIPSRPTPSTRPSPMPLARPSPMPLERPSPMPLERPSPMPLERPSPMPPSRPSPMPPSRPSPSAIQLPLTALPTPKPQLMSPTFALRPPRQLLPRVPPIGAAMLARRKRRRIALPLLLMLLGAITTAATVPMIYETLLSR